MPDDLTTIITLIQEHEAIQGHMRSVASTAGNWTGMEWDDLANLTHEQLQALNAKCLAIKQTMAYLEDGLKQHWEHEDKVLPELIGDRLMKSIKIEHDEIVKQAAGD